MSDPNRERLIGMAVAGDWPRSVASTVTDDTVAGWAARALKEARDAASRRLDGSEKRLALAALDALREKPVTEAVARLGVARFRAVLVQLADGKRDEAAKVWLDPELSFDERRRAMRDFTLFALEQGEQRAKDWATFLGALEELGAKALGIVLPILAAAVV